MADNSIAIWNKLPHITEREGLVHRASVFQPTGWPLNMLKPSLQHIQTMEAKRAMLIMDTVITKIILVSTFPTIASNPGMYALLLGREANVLLSNFLPRALEYESLLRNAKSGIFREENDSSGNGSNDSDEEIIQSRNSKIKQLEKEIFDIVRKLLQLFVEDPSITKALVRHYIQWDLELTGPIKLLLNYLVQWRYLMRNEFLTTTDERRHRESTLEYIRKHCKKQVLEIEKRYHQLISVNEVFEKMVDEKEQKLDYLRTKLTWIEEKSRDSIQTANTEFSGTLNDAKNRFREENKFRSNEYRRTSTTLEHTCSTNRREILQLRRSKWMICDELETLMRSRDDELFKLQRIVDEKRMCLEMEIKDYDLLNEKYMKIKIEYDLIMEENRKLQEELRKENEERKMMHEAATFITSLFRSWKTRKNIKMIRRRNKQLGL